jgi:hypothetical protein
MKKDKYFHWNCDGQDYLVLAPDLKTAETMAFNWWMKSNHPGKKDCADTRYQWYDANEIDEMKPTKCRGIYW